MTAPIIKQIANTEIVLLTSCSFVGQMTFLSSFLISLKNLAILFPKLASLLPKPAGLDVRAFSDIMCTSAHYFVSLCTVCLWQNLQYFFISILSGSFFLFFMVL